MLGLKINIPNLGTIQVWNVSMLNGVPHYNLVKLINPDEDVQTIQSEYNSNLSKLTNVDINTHFVLSEDELKRIVKNPDCLYLKPAVRIAKTYSLKPRKRGA